MLPRQGASVEHSGVRRPVLVTPGEGCRGAALVSIPWGQQEQRNLGCFTILQRGIAPGSWAGGLGQGARSNTRGQPTGDRRLSHATRGGHLLCTLARRGGAVHRVVAILSAQP